MMITLPVLLVLQLAVGRQHDRPAAPSAAAGVGLVMPPRIEPRHATISTSGGKTTRNSSFCPSRAGMPQPVDDQRRRNEQS